MKSLLEKQSKYSKHGAEDTEGRESLWELVQSAVCGTDYNPDDIWDVCYEKAAIEVFQTMGR